MHPMFADIVSSYPDFSFAFVAKDVGQSRGNPGVRACGALSSTVHDRSLLSLSAPSPAFVTCFNLRACGAGILPLAAHI